jgi:hypothetical protein
MLFHANPDPQHFLLQKRYHRHSTKKNVTSCLIEVLEEQVSDPPGDGVLHHHELRGDGCVGGGYERVQDQAGLLPALGYCAGGQGATQEAADGQARAGQSSVSSRLEEAILLLNQGREESKRLLP